MQFKIQPLQYLYVPEFFEVRVSQSILSTNSEAKRSNKVEDIDHIIIVFSTNLFSGSYSHSLVIRSIHCLEPCFRSGYTPVTGLYGKLNSMLRD